MADPVDPQAFLNLCDMSIDNMYELEALGELLEQKGLITKQEVIDLATSLKQKANPRAETQKFTDVENAVIEQIMDVILQQGLTAQQAKALLERTILLLDWGEKAAPKTMH